MLFAVTFSVLPRLQVGNPAAIKAPGRPEELACHLGNCQTLQTVAKETRCIRMFILLDLVGVGRNTIGIFHDFSVSVSPCCLSLLFVSGCLNSFRFLGAKRRSAATPEVPSETLHLLRVH